MGDGLTAPAPLREEDLVCAKCTLPPPGITACKKHGTAELEYKCRFCCGNAVWFCFGTTHFCEPCHSKWRGKAEVVPCPGLATCKLGVPHPPNGDGVAAEFALGCGACRGAI